MVYTEVLRESKESQAAIIDALRNQLNAARDDYALKIGERDAQLNSMQAESEAVTKAIAELKQQLAQTEAKKIASLEEQSSLWDVLKASDDQLKQSLDRIDHYEEKANRFSALVDQKEKELTEAEKAFGLIHKELQQWTANAKKWETDYLKLKKQVEPFMVGVCSAVFTEI